MRIGNSSVDLSPQREPAHVDGMSECPVLIVGAGPTGLVLALWLTRLGVPLRIIDKAAEPGTTSRAVGVQARTLELYDQIGLAEAVVDAGVVVPGANLWVGHDRAARLSLERIGRGLSPFPFLLIYPQDAHEKLLIARLNALGVVVDRRTEFLRLNQRSDGVDVVFKKPDGSEQTSQFAYVAGCDGAHSAVRAALATEFPGGTYSGVFYVADADAAGPAADGEVHVDLDDADFIAVFPLKGERRVRLIGPVSWQHDGPRHNLTFADIGDRAIANLQLTVHAVNWFSTYRVHHRVASRFRVARVFLLGDAAHVHSPVGGQGMNTGIGDAVNLAWKLQAALNGGDGDRLLGTYEQERRPFAQLLVATTDRAFTLVTKRGVVARWVRTLLAPALVPMLFRFRFIRRALFRRVSQIAVAYRKSALSMGTTGSIRGGDRLPWVRLGEDSHNFIPLRSLQWQVHVYGEARDGLAAACAELGLSLHAFAWQAQMHRAGLRRAALYLVRPDGYVAIADSNAAVSTLRNYCHSWRIPART